MSSGRGRTFLGVEHSFGGNRWVDRLDDRAAAYATSMAQEGLTTAIVGRILAGRGVVPEEAEAFLNPSVRDLMPDPSVLTDMDAAAHRIADAVDREESVAIFGDYDVDGASSSALLFRFLSGQGLEPRIYIPDRIFEGYGPNVEAIRQLAAEGHKLIVAVDCGTASFDALAEARQLGLDVVVLDHHEAGVDLPPANAIVNPNRQDDLSGLGYLAAVGVVFMTVVAVNRELRRRGRYAGERREPDLLAWLDLAALGTVCDVVPLEALNRAFVVKGVATMAQRSNRGLAALADVSRLGGPIAPDHLGFILGPRINAGGRIGDASLGARLLSCDDMALCQNLAAELDRLNTERRGQEQAMLEEAIAEAEAEIGDGDGPPVIVTAHERWHPGIVGLVASRLKDRFKRPAVAIALQPNGTGTGSARSWPGFDIGRAVRQAAAAGILAKGGGHPMAAGLTVDASALGELRGFLNRAFKEASEVPDRHDLSIDAAVSARGATVDLVKEMETAGPFGAGHPEPVLVLPAHAVDYAEATEAGHVRLTIASRDGAKLKAIAFRTADTPVGRALLERRGEALHFAGSLDIDRYRGAEKPSFRVRDLAAAEEA